MDRATGAFCGAVLSNVLDPRPGHCLRRRHMHAQEAQIKGRAPLYRVKVERGEKHCSKCNAFVDRDVSGALTIASAGEATLRYGDAARPLHLQLQAEETAVSATCFVLRKLAGARRAVISPIN